MVAGGGAPIIVATVPAGTRHQSGLCLPATTLAAQGGIVTTVSVTWSKKCDENVTHYRCADNYTEVESSCLVRISECCTGMLITVGVLTNWNQDANCNHVTPVQQVIEEVFLVWLLQT